MEEQIPDLTGGLDRLLERKAFGELSEKERSHVLRLITEDEYTRLRRTVLLAREAGGAGHTLNPDPGVKERLMARFDAVKPAAGKVRSGQLSRILNHPVPVYQVGMAATLFLVFFFYFLLKQNPVQRPVAAADTVYLEKILRETDTVWLEKQAPAEQSQKTTLQSGKSKQVSKHDKPRYAEAKTREGENPYQRSQMQEALTRVARVSDLEKARSRSRDTALLRLLVSVY
jgi:hypothetical protein